MPEFVSGLALGAFGLLEFCKRTSSAVSDPALVIREKARDAADHFEEAETHSPRVHASTQELWALQNECGESNWDGEDAVPLSRLAVEQTIHLLHLLPSHLPLPEFTAEPDGSISVDWIVARHSLVSASIGTNNRVAYAWLNGTDKGHGVERMDVDRFPPRLAQCIALAYAGSSSIRAS